MRFISIRNVAVSIFAIAVILSASFSVYLVRSEAFGEVLWSDKESYFFITVVDDGLPMKWLRYPLHRTLSLVPGYVASPGDSRRSLVVIRVTPSSVGRHVVELGDLSPGLGPNAFTPLEGRIWANYQAIGGLCWWAADHFEPATGDEKLRLGRTGNFAGAKHADGWSDNPNGMKMGDVTLRMHGHGYEGDDSGPLVIETSGPGQELTIVYTFAPRYGRVSGDEYRRTFPASE